MCRKCHGKGRYYKQERPGMYRIIPCHCQKDTKQEFESFQERLKREYVKFYGNVKNHS